jgi:hypothetical protein
MRILLPLIALLLNASAWASEDRPGIDARILRLVCKPTTAALPSPCGRTKRRNPRKTF